MAALNHHSKGSRHPGHKNRSVFFTPNATISYWQARQSNAYLPTLQILYESTLHLSSSKETVDADDAREALGAILEFIQMVAPARVTTGGAASQSGTRDTIPERVICNIIHTSYRAGQKSKSSGLAMDYGEYGIRVLAINPGTIETPLVTGLLEMGGADYKAAGRPYPLQSRCGHVDEIGHVAVFLASSKASYMTGTDVSVDGGITAAGNWAT